MSNARFIDSLQPILSTFAETQSEQLDEAAERMAKAIASGGLVHLFGSGHSVIPVMDCYPRYGSFVGFNPLTDPRLMWCSVLDAGGVRELLWLERTEGYIRQYLANRPISAGDVLVVFSHGGRNAAPVEAAMYGREAGACVVGVSAASNTERPVQHSSGQRLFDVSDIRVDTGVPVEDALVSLDGWPAPLSSASSIVACVCVGELVWRTAERLLQRGVTMPTFVSPTVPGASVETNGEVFEAHRRYQMRAAERGEVVTGGR
jgi:uncharacterized phosphosugar-binding protein